jgi:hypothetical protein
VQFNQILIVDSIPTGERNTAQSLHADVTLRAQVFAPAPLVLYRRIDSGAGFLELLFELAAMTRATGDIPVLHIESHGNLEGLGFADGSFVPWEALRQPLIGLNVATRMNLLVVVAACDGSALVRTLNPMDRSPLFGLIGPNRTVFPWELEHSYLSFYGTLLETRSARQAVEAMRATAPGTFVYRTAEWLFQTCWNHYQATYETPEARLERGRRNVDNPPAGDVGPPITAEQFAQALAEYNRAFFERCRATFFLCDLYPDNNRRFTIEYETQ